MSDFSNGSSTQLERAQSMFLKCDFHGCDFFYRQQLADGSDGGEQIWRSKAKGKTEIPYGQKWSKANR